MKTISKFLSAAVVAIALISTSCSKDKVVALPSENVTSYTGDLGYTGSSLPIANPGNGKATISQSGTNVTISFSDGVPSISGIKFQKSGSNYVSVSEDGSVAGISFSGDNVSIGVTKDGGTWSFSGKR
jgi:hypothetical protein